VTRLVDTNLASGMWLQAASEQPLLALYWDVLRDQDLAIALQTLAESLAGAEARAWGPRRRAQQRTVLSRFTVLVPDVETAEAWARLTVHAQQRGRPLSAGDAWIGATAVRHGLTLVTHDADLDGLDFAGLDVVCRAWTR
jgi:predicted nucleic acid-binding protein